MRHDALIWLIFLLGQAVHLAVQAYSLVKADNSAAKSMTGVLKARWPVFIARGFLSSMVFWLWLDGELVAALTASGVQVPGAIAAVLGLHINGALAGLAGWGSDSILAYIPGLKSSIPTA